MLAAGVSPAPVLGDEVYGNASELRWELRQLGLEYLLNAGADLLAWMEPVATRFAKKYWGVAEGQPAATSMAALSKAIRPKQWHPVAWRAADDTKRHTRIAWQPVFGLERSGSEHRRMAANLVGRGLARGRCRALPSLPSVVQNQTHPTALSAFEPGTLRR